MARDTAEVITKEGFFERFADGVVHISVHTPGKDDHRFFLSLTADEWTETIFGLDTLGEVAPRA